MCCYEIRAEIMHDHTLDKASLRRMLLANRQAIPAEVRQQWDAAIGARVLAWWNANPVRSLGVYWPIRNEPDLRTLYQTLARRGVQLGLPTVTARDAPLRFICWQPGDALVKDGFGAMVPQEASIALKPEALLIPCVGFNRDNFRLGYGGGFYDRTLAGAPRPATVGVAYECCRAEFGADVFDIPLDAVITEQSLATPAP
ncbi:MAG: 5-formyltetrahydrofolate cyclo-ligase [Bacillota bacterium]